MPALFWAAKTKDVLDSIAVFRFLDLRLVLIRPTFWFALAEQFC